MSIERLDNFFEDLFKDLFAENEKDKLVMIQLNKIGLCLNFQNEVLGKLFSINKRIVDKLGENNMKLNELSQDLAALELLFTKVSTEIQDATAVLEARIVELLAEVAASGNPDVPADVLAKLQSIRAIGESLDALNPDVVVEPTPEPVVEVPVEEPVVEVPVEEVPAEETPVDEQPQE